MLPVISVINKIINTRQIHNLSHIKIKYQNKSFFRKINKPYDKDSNSSIKKIEFNSNYLTKTSKNFIRKLTFLTSLVFLSIFLSHPFFSTNVIINTANSSKFSKKNLSQKLSQVPVFAVTNATGQPYLANNSNGEQIGLIFFSEEDALAMLKSMQKTHQALEARIYIMGLDKAYRMVLSNASSSGIQGNLGQELKMIFRFYPDQKQIKHANSIKKNLNPIDGFKGVPVFIAEGLTIRKGGEEIIPIFLTKEDLDESWSTMCKYNPDQPLKPKIMVSNLLDLVSKMESSPQEFESFGFFPSSESVDFVKRENQKKPTARITPGVFQKI